jgi:N-acetylglutamate synthase-like GNAT family acetyltransferase
MNEDFPIRLATDDDISALETLIPLSVRALQATYYSTAQMEAALGPVFGVDRQLIRDGTYFVVEHEKQIIGCGGWSQRKAMFGGDRDRPGENALLDPLQDPARIRAFFVHPDWARRGIGRKILLACEAASQAAGFQTAELVATLAGEPLYAAFGYAVRERYEVPMTGGLTLPVVRMAKHFGDDAFLRAFETQSIPLALWNHRSHLKVAYLFLNLHPFAEALQRMRSGVRAYNSANGIQDTPTGGYHETMTCAWLQLVHTTLRQFGPAATADAFLDAQSQLGQKRNLLLFYSRDRIMSAEAKSTFVEPDLAPLPKPLP